MKKSGRGLPFVLFTVEKSTAGIMTVKIAGGMGRAPVAAYMTTINTLMDDPWSSREATNYQSWTVENRSFDDVRIADTLGNHQLALTGLIVVCPVVEKWPISF